MNNEPDSSCPYKIHLSNRHIENEKDRNISCAAEFQTILEPIIDLNSRIFLKSLNAEMCLDDLHIFSIPLSITDKDSITFKIHLDPKIAESNVIIAAEDLERENEIIHTIPLDNVSFTNNLEALNYINSKLANKTNLALCGRYLELFLDSDIYNNNYNPTKIEKLTQNELTLCQYYLELGFLFRETTLAVISTLLREEEPKTVASVFKQSMTEDLEKKILKESPYFFQKDERKKVQRQLFTLDTYIDFKNPQELKTAKDNFRLSLLLFLKDSNFIND